MCFSFVVEIQRRETSEVKAMGEVPHGFTLIPFICLLVSLPVVTDKLLTSVVALLPN